MFIRDKVFSGAIFPTIKLIYSRNVNLYEFTFTHIKRQDFLDCNHDSIGKFLVIDRDGEAAKRLLFEWFENQEMNVPIELYTITTIMLISNIRTNIRGVVNVTYTW